MNSKTYFIFYFTPPRGIGKVIAVEAKSDSQSNALRSTIIDSRVSEYCRLACVASNVTDDQMTHVSIVNFIEDIVDPDRYDSSIFDLISQTSQTDVKSLDDHGVTVDDRAEVALKALVNLGFKKSEVRKFLNVQSVDKPIEEIVRDGINHFTQRSL